MEIKYDKNSIIKILKNKKIKVTPNRFKVAFELFNCDEHPSIDELHQKLVRNNENRISFTSVYNILKLFENAELVKEILIDNKIHYDSNITPHAHFICENCGEVQDIELNKLNFLDERKLFNFKTFTEEELKNNKINSFEINFYGICGKCLKEENSEE
ncbi:MULTISPECIES: Fur family transcriptional regulator [Petrotoga]|uniref:Fur family peroxide stress response transcriptional regulator n=1 Tax=Petrotoga sibirica TaxID=156202 RepID=A0A4R8ELP4_9BACT|nr:MULTISPECIES: transcriptional repressor [Petrotoga]TDX10927.1 Fur family peroxide stress response transcriptional regulator [Petrotoga sibirica]